MLNKMCYLFGVLLILFASCKKEEDGTIPTISIVSPTNGQFFSVGDTIYIQGNVRDDKSLRSISISLNDENNISTGNSIVVSVNSESNYVLNEKLVLDDEQMNSGVYNLTITVNDGTNSAIKFIELNISEFPRRRNGFILFSNNGASTNIVKLDSLNNASTLYNSSGDFLYGAVNTINQEVISCGNTSGNLTAYNLETGMTSWNVNNNAAGSAHFTGMAVNKNHTYVGYYNQNIQSYLKSGIPSFSAQALTSFYAEQMSVHNNDLLITEQKHKTSTEIRLVAYYLASGVEKQNVIINEDVVDLYSVSANELVVFSNNSGNGEIQIFDINQNSIWQPFALSTGLIDDCTEISLGKYLIAQNGNLILVNYSNFTKTTYLAGINADKVKYDNLTNQLGVISGTEFSVYDYSSKTKMTSYINSEAISDFDFWYNK
jgi:hypothetical protein